MKPVSAKQTVVALNRAYLEMATELCRQDQELASIMLHLGNEDVERLAEITAADLNRLQGVPTALVHPHSIMRAVINAEDEGDILPTVFGAIHDGGGAKR